MGDEYRMIIFKTAGYEIYNRVIHNYMKFDIINDDIDIGDAIEEIFPKYLYREQYLKCKSILEEIFNWTSEDDMFYHDLQAFHEVALYGIIKCMAAYEEDDILEEYVFDEKFYEQVETLYKLYCQYETGHITLSAEISGLIDYLIDKTKH